MPLMVSYCCGIADAKDTSAVRLNVAINRPCVRYIVPGEDIII